MSNANWKAQVAIKYSHKPDEISRAVAREYGIAWSTMWDFKQKLIHDEVSLIETPPKILFFDIETSPVMADVWSLWNNNVGLNQIHRDWFMLSWAAKWLGESEVFYDDLFRKLQPPYEDDLPIICTLWDMLDRADIIVGHNLKKFDNKKFKARCLYHGITPPSSYRMIDTLSIAKQEFALTSNKLDFLATHLGLANKVHHEGHQLWVKCIAGVKEAWDIMEEYNKYDVTLLEDVYLKIRQWDRSHPNVAVYYKDYKRRCNVCGSTNIVATGNTVKTNLSEYLEYSCGECGKKSRGSKNLLDKEKRDSLVRNVI